MAATNFNWYEIPELRVWRQRNGENDVTEIEMEAFGPEDAVGVMMAALQNNTVSDIYIWLDIFSAIFLGSYYICASR